jgi:hypothetical protein
MCEHAVCVDFLARIKIAETFFLTLDCEFFLVLAIYSDFMRKTSSLEVIYRHQEMQ